MASSKKVSWITYSVMTFFLFLQLFVRMPDPSSIPLFVVGLLLFLIPTAAIWAYYEHQYQTFNIIAIINIVLWILQIFSSVHACYQYNDVPFFVPFTVIFLPLLLACILKESQGYNFIKFASCFSGYTLMFLFNEFAYAMGQGMKH